MDNLINNDLDLMYEWDLNHHPSEEEMNSESFYMLGLIDEWHEQDYTIYDYHLPHPYWIPSSSFVKD